LLAATKILPNMLITFTFLSTALSTTPLNLKVLYVNPTLFIMSWDDVDIKESHGGLVLGYVVKLTSSDNIRFKNLDVSNTSAVLDRLQPDTVYTVNVAYFSMKGSGPFTSPLYIHTAKGTITLFISN
jgi:hypothetical protein